MVLFVKTAPARRSGRQDDEIKNCIAKIAVGDQEALALLYERTHAAIYGFALSLLKCRQDAEDVLRDTYIQIWNAAGRCTFPGKPLVWIITITRNLALMRMREQSRTPAVTPVDRQSLCADELAASGEERLVLASVLGTLSDEERQIVMLRAMTELGHKEIAELLHLKLTTVLSKHSRALKKLHNALKEAN